MYNADDWSHLSGTYDRIRYELNEEHVHIRSRMNWFFAVNAALLVCVGITLQDHTLKLHEWVTLLTLASLGAYISLATLLSVYENLSMIRKWNERLEEETKGLDSSILKRLPLAWKSKDLPKRFFFGDLLTINLATAGIVIWGFTAFLSLRKILG